MCTEYKNTEEYFQKCTNDINSFYKRQKDVLIVIFLMYVQNLIEDLDNNN